MSLSWHAQLRIVIVKTIAEWLNVPIEVYECDMLENVELRIRSYIDECEELFGTVFDIKEWPEFKQWIDELVADDEFDLFFEEEPLNFVMEYFGFAPYQGADPKERDQIIERYQKWKDSLSNISE